MELKDFISSTIEEISLGILNASTRLEGTNAIVSPKDFRINSKDSQAFGRTKRPLLECDSEEETGETRVVQKIDFDIAVTVDETDKTNAGAKISVLSIGLGGGVETFSKTGTHSRIQFSVPIVFPSNDS